MNHTERLYEITKLTKQALDRVDRGLNPYLEYRKIRDVIDTDEHFSKKMDFRESVETYLTILVVLLSIAGAIFYGFRGLFVMLETEQFWPAFGYVIFAMVLASIAVFIIEKTSN